MERGGHEICHVFLPGHRHGDRGSIYGMFLLLSWLLPGSFLAAGILLAVPIFITGGIHMDGFMDTCDARASYGDREKKLAILKDTHTGRSL